MKVPEWVRYVIPKRLRVEGWCLSPPELGLSNQICVIGIYVPNIDQAIDFYTNTLGFEVNRQYGSKIVSLIHGELLIVLEEEENATYSQDGHFR